MEQELGAEHPAEQKRSQTAGAGFMEASQPDHAQTKAAGASQTLKDAAGLGGVKPDKYARQAHDYAAKKSNLKQKFSCSEQGVTMPFKKGQSANPGGRPKHKAFSDALRMEIAAAGANLKMLRKIAKTLLKKAEEGDLSAIREVADRLEGKPTQAIDSRFDGTVHHDVSPRESISDTLIWIEKMVEEGERKLAPMTENKKLHREKL